MATVTAVVAVRLLQLRTAAQETPDKPAEEIAPVEWVRLLRPARKRPADSPLTIREFVRQLAGLGGFLLRKHDGEPGWQSLWRGYEKLHLLLRGANLRTGKCGSGQGTLARPSSGVTIHKLPDNVARTLRDAVSMLREPNLPSATGRIAHRTDEFGKPCGW